jgi:peptidoglycan/LPS O-acetylase OafA/YrhL
MSDFQNKHFHFNQLDGFRFIAVLAVLVCHWITFPWVRNIPLGSMGVNLFFVLSGFLITRILLLDKLSLPTASVWSLLKKFYIRRSLRIFPIYYLALVVLWIINYPAIHETLGWLLTYTFNIKMSLPGVWESNTLSPLSHLWSLSVEEQFYLFYPLTLLLTPQKYLKHGIYLTIAIGVLSRALLVLWNGPTNAVYMFTTCCFDAFGLGALLAYMLLFETERLRGLLAKTPLYWAAAFIFIIGLVASHYFIPDYKECRTIFERFFFSLFGFLIIGRAALSEFKGSFQRFIQNKKIVYLGQISYGIYLYHFFARPIFVMTNKPYYIYKELTGGNILMNALVFIIMTFAVSYLSWEYFEKPINRLKNKFTS